MPSGVYRPESISCCDCGMMSFNQLIAVFIYTVLAVIAGFFFHFWKSNFDPMPDRWSGNEAIDMLTTEHSLDKKMFGTEYNDNGFWQWHSLRNIAYYVLTTVAAVWLFIAATGLQPSTDLLCTALKTLGQKPLFCPG